MIEHLQKIGVTTIELLPIHAMVQDRHLVEQGLRNYGLDAEDVARPVRVIVDAGPVLERSHAARVGLGFPSKAANLLDPEWGPWMLLGELFLDRAPDAVPDAPTFPTCGTCTACLDACPTNAFPEPYVLDARRCISYLTIELRDEPIPTELREGLGDWVFGCDICQEVCPWNSEPRPRSEPELAARQENIFPELSELASLNAESFAARFPQSPIKRTGFRGLLRNTIIALGNSTPRKGLELLEELAGREDVQSDPLLRGTLERARSRMLAADTGSNYADGSDPEN